jgi:hypothetical protein
MMIFSFLKISKCLSLFPLFIAGQLYALKVDCELGARLTSEQIASLKEAASLKRRFLTKATQGLGPQLVIVGYSHNLGLISLLSKKEFDSCQSDF